MAGVKKPLAASPALVQDPSTQNCPKAHWKLIAALPHDELLVSGIGVVADIAEKLEIFVIGSEQIP